MRASAAATMQAIRALEGAIEPGRTENQDRSHLHARVIADDGDFVETRLFNSGPRTYPWFQESSPGPIEAGDLVTLDTDVVGACGYYTDFSCTFLASDPPPTRSQRALYRLAREGVECNATPIRPGLIRPGGHRSRARRAGVAHPGAVLPAALLRARPRLRHDRRVPLHPAPAGLRVRLRWRRRARHGALRGALHRRGRRPRGREARAPVGVTPDGVENLTPTLG